METLRKVREFLGRAEEFAAVFYVGGWGRMLNLVFCSSLDLELNERLMLMGTITAMFDPATDPVSHALINEFHAANKIISSVCHGPVASHSSNSIRESISRMVNQ